ncbi:YcxB family protein [Occallatibacter riparius]|uniref:YcxB family protein n=1 Tax=Occallatibacter riparius TaxID=1002689 RepID=A0A9J7BP30_9BACT|nr:YcxB family protein [Occallatibacter riparius]UWZ83506.1 YcxB family protein [Occallatibacter riparius]
MPQLQFHFELSDYVQAQRLHRQTSRALFDFLLPACGAIFFAVGMAMRRTGSYTTAGIEFTASLLFLSFPVLVRLNWRYCYRRTRSNDGEWNLEISDDLIRTHTNNSKSEVHWSAIRSFAEDQNMFLLYLAPAKFLPIPKRACTAAQIDELRVLFTQRVGTSQ